MGNLRVSEITEFMVAHQKGEDGAFDNAVSALYPELKRIAHHQLAGLGGNATMQTTAIVNEAYLKLSNSSSEAVSRRHFLAIATRAMRSVIIDYARAQCAAKRGDGQVKESLEDVDVGLMAEAEELLVVDDALTQLASEHPRLAQVFECKYFAGLDDDETAQVLDLSKRTAQRDWLKARAFLGEYLAEGGGPRG